MKKFLAILLAVMMVLSLAACGQSAKDPAKNDAPKAKLGVVVPDLNNAFCSDMANGIKRAADEKGYEVVSVLTQANPENDVSALENLSATGVKAYYGIHMLTETVGEQLKSTYPEIGCLSQTAFDGAGGVIVEDFNNIATIFCESLDAFIAEKGITSGEICGIWMTLCEVEGTTENEAYTIITNYINEHYAGTGITYVTSQFTADAEDVGNTTETLLNRYPDAKFFFAYNNDFAITTSNIIAASVPDTSEYYVFSSESDAESYRMIADENSPYRGCAAGSTEETGYQVGKQLINWIENGTMENVPVAKKLCDWRNVSEFAQ